MSEKLPRRDFLSQLTVGLGTLFALPFSGAANAFAGAANSNKEAIKKISEMGFQWDTLDPFLFCVHHEDKFPKGNAVMGPVTPLNGRHLGDDFIIKDGFRMYHGKTVPGFPGHPHRGFETVTVVREGIVDHADSMGAAGRYGDGDVQWMTAGRGVQHSEMFPLIDTDKDNPMELFQIWLNLPKKNKMVDPHFKMLWSDAIPKYTHKDSGGRKTVVEVIAGRLNGFQAPAPPPDSWAADINNDVAIWNIRMEPNAQFTLPASLVGVNRMIYYYEGNSISMAGKPIASYHSVEVHSDVDILLQNGPTEAKLLVLQGKPIGEPVIQYGPFVMNTKEEIKQTFDEYHQTQFGGWPWPKYDQVHERSKGRFALHADGRLETKS